MMAYLDQNTSRSGAPNQNYAREIMELHTLGVDGGYTQDDVAELSRVLTGWTIQGKGAVRVQPDDPRQGHQDGAGRDDPAGIAVAGTGGINEGEQMLDFLVNHPSTATFIATKMLKWLLDPNPTDAQIATVASAYKATGGDIKAMIRVILNDDVAAGRADEAQAAVPFRRVGAALDESDGHEHRRRSTTSSTTSASGCSRGTRPTAIPTRSSTGRATSCRGGASPPRCRARTRRRPIASTRRRIAPARPTAAVDLIDQNFFGGEMPLVDAQRAPRVRGPARSPTQARARRSRSPISANAFQWY